ncbi:hypothetical protein BN000_05578 [Mycobacterium europaeum]|uniref:Uncharacterized protein n=1 Tax=Mycobacterium europaeum TaxID=761804 RepID=A0A0U1DT35_9MYCO|nr:hypothetical protein [Mycobacterium europaeum]CQD22352.1 hypothetical protein BN000_05578 [Mycobacterium europaeum]
MDTVIRGHDAAKVPFEVREPRCRVCRNETVRIVVNQLLNWRSIPITLGSGKIHVVTYADILRDLEPLNARLDKSRRITYHSLRAHAERHHDVAAYCDSQIQKMLAALHGLTVDEYRNFLMQSN